MKPIFIIGSSGQDGYYLSRKFIEAGHTVIGLKHNLVQGRQVEDYSLIDKPFYTVKLNLYKKNQVERLIYDYDPQMIFHLGGVYYSSNFSNLDLPFFNEQYKCNYVISKNIIHALEKYATEAKFIFAGSSRMYSTEFIDKKIEIETDPSPQDFYGKTKLMTWSLIKKYRVSKNLDLSLAILFNHDSPKRKSGYLSPDIATSIHKYITSGTPIKLKNLNNRIDISDARDIVDGMYLMAKKTSGHDFIFASGRLLSIFEILKRSMLELGLSISDIEAFHNNKKHSNFHPGIYGAIELTKETLDWRPKIDISETIAEIYNQIRS